MIEQPDNRPVSKGGRITAANQIGGDFIKKALEGWGIEHPALKDPGDGKR